MIYSFKQKSEKNYQAKHKYYVFHYPEKDYINRKIILTERVSDSNDFMVNF